MVSAEIGIKIKISARKVEFRILFKSSNFFSEYNCAKIGNDATPMAWPTRPSGTRIKVFPQVSQVMDPARRYEPNARMIQSSTNESDSASIMGTDSFRNIQKPGGRNLRCGEN